MHWTAVIEKTENQLWKRSACILRVTKLHTLANIVLQKSNILLDGEKKKMERRRRQPAQFDEKNSVEWKGNLLH